VTTNAAEVGWFRPCAESPAADPGALPSGLSQAVPEPTTVPPVAKFRWPTNQWWTSLVTGEPQPLWAPPLVVQITPEGLGVGVPIVGAAPNSVISAPRVDLTVTTAHDAVRVTDFGDFHVSAALDQAGEQQLAFTVAQGSLATWIEAQSPTISVQPGSAVSWEQGALPSSSGPRTDHVWVEQADGQRWDLVSSQPVRWSFEGTTVAAASDAPITVGIVARPKNAASNWGDTAYVSGLDPVVDTIAEWQMQTGSVRQRLTYRRLRNGAGAVAILPHQQSTLGVAEPVAGTFDSHLGTLTLQLTDAIEWSAPLPGMLLGVPAIEPAPADRAKIDAALVATTDAATAVGSFEPAGSYFGPKELGRLASTLDVARALDAPQSDALQQSLTDRLDRWLTESEQPDDRWLGYDPVWGGVSASSPEFGLENYNDHHFQYGYLIQAAATVAERDGEAAKRWAPVIDLIAADLGMACRDGFPRMRVVNPYLGHSVASGMVPFTDGINQESSSESLHAWWSLARWATATGETSVAKNATAMYAMEAQAARTYWLGEETTRPSGYGHDVAGIVWGGKIDFATFFDARPASVVGIQLLPFTFGSLYRSNPQGAATRYTAGSLDSGQRWQDILALDLALSDPVSASTILDTVAASTDGFEGGVSQAFAYYWVAALATLGPPDTSIVSNPPYGMAFTSQAGITSYVAINPTSKPLNVSFTKNGTEVATLKVPARSTARG
jgi:endo-1,3(4)-beta-glucanase